MIAYRGRVDILPGAGVDQVRIGDSREDVEARLGNPIETGATRTIHETTPLLILTYGEDDTVEAVEVAYSGGNAEEAWFDGVQLTFRFLDEVVADLAAKGYKADAAYRFREGFALFSMGSRHARDLDPAAAGDDPRAVCEGVSIAPYGYLAG